MNTMTALTRQPRRLIAAAIGITMISSFSTLCNSGTPDVPKTMVRYADLDISTTQGATALYNRIRFAAEGVCSGYFHDDLVAKSGWKLCMKEAIEGAVTKVNQPALSAVYAANYGMPRPETILTADRR